MLPGLKQLKLSRNFWTFSRRSFTFIDLKFSHVQMGCCPSLKGHSKFLGLLDSSAFEAKVLVFVLSRLWNLFLSNDELVCANKFSGVTALEASHSFKTNRLPLSSRRSCIYCNQWSLSCGESFVVVELSPRSDSRSDVYPSWVKVFTTIVTTFANLTILVESSCRTGEWVCIFLKWALTMTSDLPYFSQSISQAWYYDCELNPIPDIAAFAWPVRLVFRYCMFSVSLIGFWWTTSKRPDHSGHSRGAPQNSVSFSLGKPLAPLLGTGWSMTWGVVWFIVLLFLLSADLFRELLMGLWLLFLSWTADVPWSWNVVLVNGGAGSVTLIGLRISGFLRMLGSVSCVEKISSPGWNSGVVFG